MEAEPKYGARGALVSVVMLAILLVSCGAAWLLVNDRQAASRRGEEIVQTIRTEGLAHYWGTGEPDLWFLETHGGEIVGWKNIRWRHEENDYVGTDVSSSSLEGAPVVGEWFRVRPDLSVTEYVGTVSAEEQGMQTQLQTRIEQKDKKISAVQRATVRNIAHISEGKGAAPENYVPDGTMSLALRLTIERGKKASFQMILDQLAIGDGKEVRFVNVVVTPEGPRTARVEYATPRQTFSETYVFDEHWNVESVDDHTSDIKLDRVDLARVAKHFPDAESIRDAFGPERN